MNIWTAEKWKDKYENSSVRHGLRLRCDGDIDEEARRASKDFCKWLRKNYVFPIRVPVYLKSSCKIKAMDGEMVYATFFEPFDCYVEPYIRIAVGDYQHSEKSVGKDNALAGILDSIAHELTHYFQWINDIELTDTEYERQAKKCSELIIYEYSQTREHP